MKSILVILILVGASESVGLDQPIADRYDAFTEPYRTIEVCAAESGRIASVCVQKGDEVGPETVLMELDCSVLRAQREIALQEAESVSRVDALLVEHELREHRLNQMRKLRGEGAGSLEEVKRAEADASVAKLNVAAAEETRQLAKLKIKEIDAKIAQRRVLGTLRGLVVEVLREPGEYVSATSPHVVTVVQLHQLRATFYLPTEQAARLTREQSIELNVAGLNEPVTGIIEYVAAVTEAESGRAQVDVLIDNASQRIRSGVRCSFAFPVHRFENILIENSPEAHQ